MKCTRILSQTAFVLSLVLSPFYFLQSASAADNVVLRWDNAALQAVRDVRFGPPMTARALAIAHTCMFDAWAAYDDQAIGTQLGGSLRRPPAEQNDTNKTIAVSFAAYRALVDLFPARKASFDALMAQLGLDPANTTVDTSTPQGVGNVACNAVLQVRHKDGSNQLGDLHAPAYSDYTGYVPVNQPGQINDLSRWEPLSVPNGTGGFNKQSFLVPHWGNVTPFALESGAEFRPTGPLLYFPNAATAQERQSNRLFLTQAREILNISGRLNDTTKAIAEYWSDGPASETPPGHWCLLAQFVSHRDGHTIDEDVKLYFVLANALFDASIASWDAKRAYDSVRPITAIRTLFRGQKVRAWAGRNLGTQTIPGESWQPFQAATFVTPPFPGHISGHCTFSAAAATVLKLYTGSDFFGARVTLPAGSSKLEPGTHPARAVTLRWQSFSDASTQAGTSRLYGGIHFERDNLYGRRVGLQVGRRAWDKAQTFIRGR